MIFIRGNSRMIHDASICNEQPAKVNQLSVQKNAYRPASWLRSGALQHAIADATTGDRRPTTAVLDDRV
jgi:hypothetical protein